MAKLDSADIRLKKATELFARLKNEGATDDDREIAEAWVREAPENQIAWREVVALWAYLGDSPDEPLLADARERARANLAVAPSHRYLRRWLPVAAAACLMGIAGVSAIWWTQHREGDAVHLSAPASTGLQAQSQIYASTIGQRRMVRLVDGSTIELNSDSQVAVTFSSHRRDVRLVKGQAFFSVSKDRTRPFVVDTGALKVIAVGTAFDVRRGANGADVTTMEGLVRVEPLKRSTVLTPTLVPAGSKLSMLCDRLRVGKVDVRRETIWTRGLIAFDSRCLGDVADEMNRYSRRKLIVNPSAANLTISGTFRASNAAAFARALQQKGLVEVDEEGDEIRLSASPQAGTPRSLCHSRKS
jgi:transmembrane sensor